MHLSIMKDGEVGHHVGPGSAGLAICQAEPPHEQQWVEVIAKLFGLTGARGKALQAESRGRPLLGGCS